MKIEDIMTSKVIQIREYIPFTQACRLFFQFKIHHLPVVNKDNKFIGMLSAHDALKAYNDKVFNRLITNEEQLNDLIKIPNIMSTGLLFYLNKNNTVKEAIEIFNSVDIHALPILDDNQSPIGIFTTNDILKNWKTLVIA